MPPAAPSAPAVPPLRGHRVRRAVLGVLLLAGFLLLAFAVCGRAHADVPPSPALRPSAAVPAPGPAPAGRAVRAAGRADVRGVAGTLTAVAARRSPAPPASLLGTVTDATRRLTAPVVRAIGAPAPRTPPGRPGTVRPPGPRPRAGAGPKAPAPHARPAAPGPADGPSAVAPRAATPVPRAAVRPAAPAAGRRHRPVAARRPGSAPTPPATRHAGHATEGDAAAHHPGSSCAEAAAARPDLGGAPATRAPSRVPAPPRRPSDVAVQPD